MTPALQIARRREDAGAHRAERPRDQAAVRQLADAHGKVEAFVDEVDDPLREGHLEMHLGVAAGEPRQGGREQSVAHVGGSRQPNRAARHVGEVRDRFGRLVDAGERTRHRLVVGTPRLGHLYPPGRPLNEAHAEVALERRDRAADRRLRQPGRRGCGGEAPGVDHADEQPDAVQIDCRHFSISLFAST